MNYCATFSSICSLPKSRTLPLFPVKNIICLLQLLFNECQCFDQEFLYTFLLIFVDMFMVINLTLNRSRLNRKMFIQHLFM